MGLAEYDAAGDAAARILRRFAADASVEATPRAALGTDVRAVLRPGMRVYMTHLPGAPFEERRAACAALAAAGMRPVPHVAAREAPSLAALEAELGHLLDAGADAVMLIGGGGAPVGPFEDAATLLESGALQRAGVRRIGLAAHPEGHPAADAAVLRHSLSHKLALARAFADEVWLVTQFAFEAAPVVAWLDRLRAEGEGVPVRLGLSGPASPRTLLAYALRCGVGPSLKALQARPSLAARMSRRWSPDALAARLAAEAAARPALAVAGLHVFPFGGLEAAANWLAETAGEEAALLEEAG